MNEASRPVAVRVIRPYATEDEFLAEEYNTITKATITLIGAHSRPDGVILRFEVTLNNGKPLVRGEGRVTSFVQKGRDGQPALTLRFTKLDPKSKALVDRAVTFRDGPQPPARTALAEGAPPPPPSSDAIAERPEKVGDPFEATTTPASSRVAANEPPTYDPSRAITRSMPVVKPMPTVPAPAAYGDTRRKSDAPPPLPSMLAGRTTPVPPAPLVMTPLRPPTLSPPPLPVMELAQEKTDAERADADAAPASRFPTAPPSLDAKSTEKPAQMPAPVHEELRDEARERQTSGGGRVNRNAALARLRSRADALSPEERARILKSRVRGAHG